METQLEISLITRIAETFSEARTLAEDSKERGRLAVLKARECGQYLKEAKETAGHGGWLTWFEANRQALGDFSISTAKNYIRLADIPENALESMASLKQAYLALNILPEPNREPGSQTAHPDAQKWLTSLLKAQEFITTAIERRPIQEWPEPQRITLKEKLRPMAELYAKL